MWNEQINGLMTGLATQIEASFEPVQAKVQEINTWMDQLKADINSEDFQPNAHSEPIETTRKRQKRTKKNAETGKETLPVDVSPFDSILSESGSSRMTRSSGVAKNVNKESDLKFNISEETFTIPTRSSRAASKAAASKINSQLNISLTKKLRRPSSEGRTEASMEFIPPVSSTVLACKNDGPFLNTSPGPSVKQQIRVFEKLTAQSSPVPEVGESSDKESLPKTPAARVTRSKARFSGKTKKSGSGTKTLIIKPKVLQLKVKRLSTGAKPRLSGPLEKDKEVKSGAGSSKPQAIFPSKKEEEETLRKKREELLKKQEKEEEARKKKEESLKMLSELSKRKREEKRMKAAAAREANEKQKQEAALKVEREKEERKKIQLEREEKLREEQAKKRNLTAQKAAETEERRRQEEAARQARLREMAEEQKRAAAIKLREQEENAAMKRKLEEAKQAKKLGKEPKKEVQEYKCTPTREERPLKKPKTEDDYGVEDASASDSSDDEANPKKEIPRWATASNRNPQLLLQTYYPFRYLHQFMSCKKEVDLTQIFKSSEVRVRNRTSSAVWSSPLSTTFTRK
nr:PREDICTED: axoneme-associated protein mst101(2)-like [Bemisia tabaci]